MREIIFRGQTEEGEWILGDLKQCLYHKLIGRYIDLPPTRSDTVGEQAYKYEIIKEDTIGEFSGLPDKKGDRVFEGSICKITKTHNGSYNQFQGDDACSHEELITQCVFEDGSFKFIREYLKKGKYFTRAIISLSNSDVIEIIGNIHDNPELLKQ